jgi:hypothetical protein
MYVSFIFQGSQPNFVLLLILQIGVKCELHYFY